MQLLRSSLLAALCLAMTAVAAPAAAIDFSNMPPPAYGACRPYIEALQGWSLPDPKKTFRVPQAGWAVECDVRHMTISVEGVGYLRSVYKPDPKVNLPYGAAIVPLISELQVRGREHLDRGKAGPLKILVFAHGGLTSQTQAVEMAQRLAPAMLEDGYAPIFLVWNSDFPRAYWSRLCCVRDGEDSSKYAAFSVPSRLLGDAATSVVRAPQNLGGFVVRGLETSDRNSRKYYLQPGEIAGLCLKIAPKDQAACETRFTVPANNGDDTPAAEEAAHFMPQIFALRMLTSAIATEPGAKSWDNMVRRTRMAFQIPLETSDACVTYDNTRTFDVGGFEPLFQRLECEIRRAPGQPATFDVGDGRRVPVEMHYYGHSMGALVGNELLDRHPDLPWKRIVYMAAASSTRDFRVTASRTVAGHADRDFYNLVLHPMNEATSREAGGVVPQGTLLEWIDELFEGPRSPDDRMMGKWNNFRDALPALQPALRRQTHVRVFPRNRVDWSAECSPPPRSGAPPPRYGAPPPEVRCHPISHGEFNEFSFWRESYLYGASGRAGR